MKDAMKLETHLVVAGSRQTLYPGSGESGYPTRLFTGI